MTHPGGRPSKYREEFVQQAFNYCLLGAIDADLARFFEVDEDTIYEWKKAYPEFAEALKNGKEAADARVAAALFKRATGYEIPAEKVFQYRGEIVKAETTEHIPPDTTAASWWLKNRRPQDWHDKHEVELSGPSVTFIDDLHIFDDDNS